MESTGTISLTVNGLDIGLARRTLHLVSLKARDDSWVDGGPDGAPLWRLLAVDREGWRVLLTATDAQEAAYETRADTLVLRWRNVRGRTSGCPEVAGPFDVAVEIAPVRDRPGLTAWRIDVRSTAREWTLWEVRFPIVSGILPSPAPETDSLFLPDGWGLKKTGWSSFASFVRRVRGWDCFMQMLGLTRGARTFAFAALDPSLATKDVEFDRGPADRPSGRMAFIHYPDGMSSEANSCTLELDFLVGVIDGDWFDAGQLYGGWARQQDWAARQPAASRPGMNAFKKVVAWQVMRVPEKPMEEWADSLERLSRRLGVTVGIHFYDWHQVPFDVSYPDYFPARHGFRALVRRMQDAGIVTMPYINARLWDVNARSWRERGAEACSAKNTGCRLDPPTTFPYLEEYGSGQSLAPMCPSTPLWRDTMVDLCRRITGELGCDGVYLDQIAAAMSLPCFDRAHGHAPGGGGFWLQGYREMLREIRAAIPPEKFLTTECNWEGMVADCDGLLMWHSHGEKALSDTGGTLIPLFPAAYPGPAQTFGCNFAAADLTEDGGTRFAARMGVLLAWGAQLGWGDLTLLLEPDHRDLAEYFGKLCVLRRDYKALFEEGMMLRPPRVEPEAGLIASAWRAEDGGTFAIVANPSRESAEASLTSPSLPAGPARRIRLSALDALVISL